MSKKLILVLLISFSAHAVHASWVHIGLKAMLPTAAFVSSGVILKKALRRLKAARARKDLVYSGSDDNILQKLVLTDHAQQIVHDALQDMYTSEKPLKTIVLNLPGFMSETPFAQAQTPDVNYFIFTPQVIKEIDSQPNPGAALQDFLHTHKINLAHECGHLYHNDSLNGHDFTIKYIKISTAAGCLANILLLYQTDIHSISKLGLLGKTALMFSLVPLTSLLRHKLQINRIKFQEARADDFALSKAKDPELIEAEADYIENIYDQAAKKEQARMGLSDRMYSIGSLLFSPWVPHLEGKARVAKWRAAAAELRKQQNNGDV